MHFASLRNCCRLQARWLLLLGASICHTPKKVISKREDYCQIDDAFSSQKWSPKFTLVSEIISFWKGRSRVTLYKDEFSSQNENYFTFELVQINFWCSNQHKEILYCDCGGWSWLVTNLRWCSGGPQPSRCSRPVGRPRLGWWTPRPVVSTLYALFLFYLVQGTHKVYSGAWCGRFERFLTQGDLVNVFHFSVFSLHHLC